MSDSNSIKFQEMSSFNIRKLNGKLILLVQFDGVIDDHIGLIDSITNGMLKSFIDSDIFKTLNAGNFTELNIFVKKEFYQL